MLFKVRGKVKIIDIQSRIISPLTLQNGIS